MDIGCHIGSMLSTILRLAPRGQHWAFEPTPSKAAWLRAKFPEVEVREMALTEDGVLVARDDELVAGQGLTHGLRLHPETAQSLAAGLVRPQGRWLVPFLLGAACALAAGGVVIALVA